tara:strand:- start:731 stop:2419 length:1689 start_codon:yes stop_codon:yes gene_type:complete
MGKDDKFLKEIRAYALKNAIDYGEAEVGKVLGKLFQHGLDKKEVKKIILKIQEIVKEVNSMTDSERGEDFESYKEKVKEREEEGERELPELPNAVKGKVVVRVAPFPSGALHIGNAKTFLLNGMYAEKYNGKVILVMDDTIGSVEKPIDKESYGLIEEGLKFLGIKYSKKVYKSDRLGLYYKHGEELIEKGKAYVCHCSQEEFKKFKDSGEDCGCRMFSVKEQKKRWEEMFEMGEGEAVLRIKTGMENPNPAFRDRVLFRISDRTHPRVGKKYRVWPTLEMSWAVDDYLLGITHIIRGNDLRIETDMEEFIWGIFGWKAPEVIHHGLVNLAGVGAKISKSKAQKEVRSGKFLGWDDPRTWSIQSLERRGITAAAFREFVKETGLSKQEVTVPIESLYSINRKMIDSESDRYFFVENAKEIKINGKPKIGKVKLPVHPDKKKTRSVSVEDVLIANSDRNNFKGKEIRLLHLFNIKLPVRGKKSEFTSLENKSIPKVQWVSTRDWQITKILMPGGEYVIGAGESGIKGLKKGELIQFERFGFVKFDRKIKEKNHYVYEFWFAHK